MSISWPPSVKHKCLSSYTIMKFAILNNLQFLLKFLVLVLYTTQSFRKNPECDHHVSATSSFLYFKISKVKVSDSILGEKQMALYKITTSPIEHQTTHLLVPRLSFIESVLWLYQ